ncbi:hypothetical protein SB2_25490 [Methylobacterium radiotolerans]|nr:hypothetical protein SB3_28215 [Methylobacterium radiotolerans]KTS44093.1 hypothetical protein SB2_25490 [Methylobacterium radiotolerans]
MTGFRTFETGRVSFGNGRPQAPVVDISLVRPASKSAAAKSGSYPKIKQQGFIPPKPAVPQDFEQYPTRTARNMLEICSAVTGVSIPDIKSERRDGKILKARQIFCWLALRYTNLASGRIGELVGGRDHSTILHSKGRVEALLESLDIEVGDCPIAMTERLWSAEWPWRR